MIKSIYYTIIFFLLFLPFAVKAQIIWDIDSQNPDSVSYLSYSEYYAALWENYVIYNNLNVASPSAYTGQGTMVKMVAGAHDLGGWDKNGKPYFTGSIFSTSEFALVGMTSDSAGDPLGVCTGISFGTAWGSEEWNVGITQSNGQPAIAGDLTGGVRGNGTAGATSQASFVYPQFYRSVFITKIQMGQAPMVLDTVNGGSVWTWGGNNGGGGGGSLSMIGRGNSPTRSFTVPDTVAIPNGIGRPVDIAAWGWWGWILTSQHRLLFIGERRDYADGGSTSNSPVDMSSFLYTYIKIPGTSLADSIVKIAVNSCGTYFICKDSTLWFLGSTVTGGGGTGNMANWPTYMSGGHVYPYNYDGGFGEVMQTHPMQISPGTHNWISIFTNACYSFGAAFLRADGRVYGLARNKADNFWLPTIQAGYVDGAIPSGYPDSWNWAYLTELIGPQVSAQPYSTTYQVTCPYCIPNNSVNDTCSTYTNPAHTPPTASLTGTAVNGVIYLNGTGTTPGPHVTHMYDYTITQNSGDPAVLDMGIQAGGANQSSLLDTISTAGGATIPNGTYHFTLRNRNTSWDSTFATLSVVVSASTQTRFYVSSSSGNDENGCTSSSYCATTAHAISLMTSGDTLSLKSGDTWTTTLYPISGIVIDTFGTGADPKIDGSYTASGWVSLGSGVYETYIPNDRAILNCVTLDGKLEGMGRYPDTGWVTYSGLTSTTLTSSYINLFPYSFTGGTVVIRDEFSVIDTIHVPVVGMNTYTLATSPSVIGGRGNGFFMMNHPNTLLTTARVGSWYNNWAKDSLQVYFGSAGPSGHTVKIAVLDTGIYLSGMNNVTVQGIDFEYFNQYHAFCNNVNHIYFDSCRFQYAGNNVFTTNNDSSATFRYDTMRYANNNFAYNTGASPYLVMKYCFGDSAGMWAGMGKSGTSSTYEGWAWGNAYGQLIHYSTFINTGYNGLYFSGDSCNIRHMSFQNYCMVKCDGGAIYSWDGSLPTYIYGDSVDYNVCVNSGSPGSGIVYDFTDIAFGIYLDNYHPKTTVYGNTGAYNTSGGAIVHGINNKFINNNWFGNGNSQFTAAEVSSHALTGLVYTGNISGYTVSAVSISFTTPNNDLNSFCTTCNTNYYLNPTGVSASLYTFSSADPGTSRSLASWQSNTGYDLGSSYQNGSLSFQYSVPGGTFSLGGNFKDALGNIYPGVLNLGPYSSVTLIGLPSSAIQVIRGSRIVIVP